jgi:hypothetical protein
VLAINQRKGDTMTDSMDYVRDLPGFDRGHPHYYKEPIIDHLLEITLQLAAEIWVNRDRQMVIEHLLATVGEVTPEAIERFEPTDEFKALQQSNRKEFTNRVFGCLYSDLPDDPRGSFVPGTINKKKA